MRTKIINVAFVVLALGLYSCADNNYKVQSQSGKLVLNFALIGETQPSYCVYYDGKQIIKPSTLGFDFKDAESLGKGLRIDSVQSREFNERWEMPWGEQHYVVNHYNELRVFLSERKDLKRNFSVVFRVFDDGVGFRYEFPEQENLKDVAIIDENTQFNLAGNHMCWWQAGDWDIYEHLYKTTRFSKIDAINSKSKNELAQTYIPENAVNTPVTMKTDDGIHLSFHEAAVENYAGITLKVDTINLAMQSELVGNDSGIKVVTKTPFNSPWRTIQIGEKAGDLIESKLILNLNEPNKLGDVSWFKPTKYVGIWWEMHLDKSTWAMAGGKHGATTANAKRYIDFAAKNGIGAILVEGWNTGWEHWIGFEDREGVFDFVTPYKDYNLKEVVEYGRGKGVDLIMHHETSSAVTTYDQQLDTAFALMSSLGLHTVKTGYVGKIIPKGEYHHGQWMVNHYRRVLETAAKYKVAVNVHEPFMATGERRTYPNFISQEGFRGQEFNAWSTDGGNPAEHLTIIPYTCLLAGPMDYTPGIFNIKLKPYKPNNQVNNTLAQQLALYVVIYSPIQMAADLPENYEGHPAFQFIRDVAVDWEQTKVLNGEVGDYITVARQERGTLRWFVGSVTDENARDLMIKLDFLDKGKKYQATMYVDAPDAHWNDNPTAYEIKKLEVDSNSELHLKLAPGGGAAISILPL
ncbi:MAG TPA: glycoside hydrolase family 97 protein [Tenuifilaceae bacterium]|nr:glycoside hydrolase family 97 protein [Tenuifilaceae bacterium]HPN21286.1 glycoside hydrolase family 97 protein [Tenuifilaceae bacterium]